MSFAAREFLKIWWYELVLPRFGMTALADRTRAARMQRFARRFHDLAVGLGGLMIKVGQFMSSRLDVLPPEITSELEGLQDEVPAVPFPDIRALAEAEIGVPLARAYAWFDETPLAAASLGQAHRARLSDQDAEETGLREVVVKVQRPGIDEIVATDLAALRRVARWASRVRIVRDRVDAPALVEEFAGTCREEIDYLHEAAGAERFAADFLDDPRVSAPAVVWERTTRRVLTLEDVTAIKINDTVALRAAGIDPTEVANVFADVMLDQVFTHGFVHADPHPGNIFVTPRAPHAEGPSWHLTFVDFGMMTEVPDSLRAGLRTFVIAVAGRDSKGLVSAAQQIGVLLPSADTRELERALTTLFARFGGMGFAELREVDPREFTGFATEFTDTVRELPVQLPENLLLLIRAVSLTSGLCSALDPAFNIWDPVEPYAARLLRDESGNLIQDFGKQAAANAGILWSLPKRVDDVISRADNGTLSFDTSRLERRLDILVGIGRRVVSAVLFMALVIGGALLLAAAPVLGWILIGVSALPLLHALFGGRRRT
ncbi:AarF/ABC1/UbiB kinase family protein [Microbacterium sp. CIAB417]|uniref:ABC1 kinase family protein n=1 Tax=Microbacterium sp. CIAB417 TaxID=2860287 RepID=UPI001FAD3D5E|nr:AarF/UbiB family protein [Microbacterium sp. CIAB417]